MFRLACFLSLVVVTCGWALGRVAKEFTYEKEKKTIPRLFSSDVLVMALRAVVGRAFLTSSLPHVFIMVLAPSSRCSEKPCIVLIRFIRLEENTANLLAPPIRKFCVYWRAHDPIQITTDR